MVNVGIIGLGPVWESRYRPALARLDRRIRVCAVFDVVAERAAQAAAELRVPCFGGIVALGERAGCDAFLVLDAGWAGIETLRLAARFRKPIYFSGSLGADAAQIRALYERIRGEGLTLMPDLGCRYTPATSRLHELMATKLGRPMRIAIDAALPQEEESCNAPRHGREPELLGALFDWCRYVVRTRPVRLAPANGHGSPGAALRLEFARPRAGGEGCVVDLRLRRKIAERSGGQIESATIVQHVVCERGEARLPGPTEIAWRENETERRESLTAERSEIEVMLDHFCRRVVGGLIPIPDLEDVRRSVEFASAVDDCLRTGREILLENSRAPES